MEIVPTLIATPPGIGHPQLEEIWDPGYLGKHLIRPHPKSPLGAVMKSYQQPCSTGPIAVVILGVGLFAVAHSAIAQPLCARTSAIETAVINSDYVFIARLVNVQPRKEGDQRHGSDTIIAIEETLKAELIREEPYEKMNVYLPYRETELQAWQKRGNRVLIALAGYNDEQNVAIELAPQTLEVMTADMKLLRDPEAVIQVARAAESRLPANVKRVHTFNLIVPRDVVAETRWISSYQTGGYLLLSVPVDEQLEKRAQGYVRSDDPLRRSEGIRALAYFKSDQNIALVKPFLDDRYFSFYSRDNTQNGERFYPVRHAAYQTLKAWGVSVEMPVYREEVRGE